MCAYSEIVYVVQHLWDVPLRGFAVAFGELQYFSTSFDTEMQRWSNVYELRPVDLSVNQMMNFRIDVPPLSTGAVTKAEGEFKLHDLDETLAIWTVRWTPV